MLKVARCFFLKCSTVKNESDKTITKEDPGIPCILLFDIILFKNIKTYNSTEYCYEILPDAVEN